MSEFVRVSTRAMATQFEIVLWGGDPGFLRACGEEALAEVERLEAQLSKYHHVSDITDINLHAYKHEIPLDPRLWNLLKRACDLSELSDGAFDITIGPLLWAWGFVDGSGKMPDLADLEFARSVTGYQHLQLSPDGHKLKFDAPGVQIDLGAIGKGYAIDQAAEILREYEPGGALIHGGTSTIQAVGGMPDGSPWRIAIQHPTEEEAHLVEVPLFDSSLSVSAVHGKFFTQAEVRYGHILDPRIGEPVQNALLSAVVAPSATDSDALSTALLVSGEPFLATLATLPGVRGLVVVASGEESVRIAGSLD